MSARSLLKPLWWFTSRPWTQPFMRVARRVVGEGRAGRWKRSLAPRFPETVICRVDAVYRIGERGAFVVGWMLDPCAEVARVEFVSGSRRQELTQMWARCSRRDVVDGVQGAPKTDLDVGFLCYLPDMPVLGKCEIRLHGVGGAVSSIVAPVQEVGAAVEWSKHALVHVPATGAKAAQMMATHIGPALQAVHSMRRTKPQITVEQFGPRLAAPSVTVVIPLYGRVDFVRYQSALFASDPAMRDVEILYFVDDPRVAADACRLALDAWKLTGLSLTVVATDRNLGFAGANNAAVAHARGQRIVLLNSDVMPGRSGWLPLIVSPLDDPKVGIVGARMLYEDGTIQHDGMRMSAYDAWGGMPIWLHPGKGLPANGLDQANADVDAVTGACMAMRTADYRKFGGLDEDFLLGDFEDADLCRRIHAEGYSIRLVRNVLLYHLERQSQWLMSDLGWRHKVSMFNCWQHARLLQGAAQ